MCINPLFKEIGALKRLNSGLIGIYKKNKKLWKHTHFLVLTPCRVQKFTQSSENGDLVKIFIMKIRLIFCHAFPCALERFFESVSTERAGLYYFSQVSKFTFSCNPKNCNKLFESYVIPSVTLFYTRTCF